jgi:hypothetical protein
MEILIYYLHSFIIVTVNIFYKTIPIYYLYSFLKNYKFHLKISLRIKITF